MSLGHLKPFCKKNSPNINLSKKTCLLQQFPTRDSQNLSNMDMLAYFVGARMVCQLAYPSCSIREIGYTSMAASMDDLQTFD
jgi:hypothetical protein